MELLTNLRDRSIKVFGNFIFKILFIKHLRICINLYKGNVSDFIYSNKIYQIKQLRICEVIPIKFRENKIPSLINPIVPPRRCRVRMTNNQSN